MTMQFSRVIKTALASCLAAALLAGCTLDKPKTAEQIVQQLAQERWDALLEGDFDKAWEYTQPAYRASVKQRDYHKRFGGAGDWKGVQVHEASCEAQRCELRVRITAVVYAAGSRATEGHEISAYNTETWIRQDGQWWYFQAL